MGQKSSKYAVAGIFSCTVAFSAYYLLSPSLQKQKEVPKFNEPSSVPAGVSSPGDFGAEAAAADVKTDLVKANMNESESVFSEFNEISTNKKYVFGKLILNDGKANEASLKEDPVKLSKKFSKMLLRLKGKFMDDEGHAVDYSKMKESPMFTEYCELSKDLKLIDLGALSEDEKKAFLINIYNALVIHGLIERNSPKEKEERQDFFPNTCYYIGGQIYSLDEIEHGLLRGNQLHPTTKTAFFAENDPRSQYVCQLDPRVHFALVCGAASCPPIRYYKAETIDRDLDGAARAFIQGEVTVSRKGEVSASKILMWYGRDFAPTEEETFRVISKYMKQSEKSLYESLTKPKIVYREYDWGLNGF